MEFHTIFGKERPFTMLENGRNLHASKWLLLFTALTILENRAHVLARPIAFNKMESFNMGYKTAVYTIENTTVNTYFDHVSFYMGYDSNKDKSREVSFFPDLNSQTTIMNELPSWGISCPNASTFDNPDTSSHCVVISNATGSSAYKQRSYSSRPAQTIFLFKDTELQQTSFQSSLLFRLGQDLNTPNWTLESTGVLGLSPSDNNPIWNYLFKMYAFKSNRFSFAFKYLSGDPKDKFKEMSPLSIEGSKMLVSDSSLDMPGATTFYPIQKTLNNEAVWYLPEVSVSFLLSDGSELPLINGVKACLTNNFHSLIAGTPDIGAKMIETVAIEMCKKVDCGADVNYGSAPKLSISINLFDGDTVKYILAPEDYIIPHLSSTNVSFSNITDWQPVTCPQDYKLAFGKLFFETSYMVFEVYKNGDKKIKLSEYIKIPKATSSEKAVMLFFISVCIFIILSITVYKVCKHRQEKLYDSSHSIPAEVTMYRSMTSDKEEETTT
jgi:hypothetical protein